MGTFRISLRIAGYLALSILMAGCATPHNIKERSSALLGPRCLSIFTNESYLQYQHVAQAPLNPRPPVFAFAKDSGGEACGWAAPRDAQDEVFSFGTTSKIEAIAIARCESAKPAGIKAPCKVFARGNEIVWDQKQSIGLE